MELREFQNKALNSVVKSYELKNKSALVVMPAGTGKTVLSVYITKTFSEKFKFKRIAFIAPTKILQSTFDSMIKNREIKSQVSAYLPSELALKISNSSIPKSHFDLIIFDDFGDREYSYYESIYNHFNCFKIGLTRTEFSKPNDLFLSESNGITYKYQIEQAIVDGYYIQSQQALSRHLYKNLEYEIENIELGTDWSLNIKENIIKYIDELRIENEEFQEVQKKILSGEIANAEILELAHKKEQLTNFEKLMNDVDFFSKQEMVFGTTEAVWQNFFESNLWIFGFGLNYIFNAPLDGKKLEQVVIGYSVTGGGKRIDALLRTTGLISSLCFGEIKTHKKDLLKNVKNPYRPDSWSVSDEMVGGIAQIHKTIQKSLKNISTTLSVKDSNGFTTYENIYLLKPKSYLIIGSLNEFKNEKGQIHEEKYSSFELFRRSVNDIEIITFDELFQRANAIINKQWR